MKKISIAVMGIVAPAIFTARSVQAAPVYIALGDSITFGETDLNYEPSTGDRGYVGLYANRLQTLTGVRPLVYNLAIDGETAASFTSGSGRVPPVAGRTDAILADENLNYNPTALVTQNAKLLSTVAAVKAAGNTVTTVSVTLGFNDLSTAVGQPSSAVLGILAAYQSQYGAILSEVRQQVPTANVLVLGYYNPFPANPTSPAAPVFNTYGTQLNGIIAGLANQYGDTFVPTAAPFVGNEAAFTYLAAQPAGSTPPAGGIYLGTEAIGNVHPNPLGYAAIAGQLAAVPEPTTLALLGIGGLALLARRRSPTA